MQDTRPGEAGVLFTPSRSTLFAETFPQTAENREAFARPDQAASGRAGAAATAGWRIARQDQGQGGVVQRLGAGARHPGAPARGCNGWRRISASERSSTRTDAAGGGRRSNQRAGDHENGPEGGYSQAEKIRLEAEAPAPAGRFQRVRPGGHLGIVLAEPALPGRSYARHRDPDDHQQGSNHHQGHRKLPTSILNVRSS